MTDEKYELEWNASSSKVALRKRIHLLEGQLAKAETSNSILLEKLRRWKGFFEGAMKAKRENDHVHRVLEIVADHVTDIGYDGRMMVAAALERAEQERREAQEKQPRDGVRPTDDPPR